MEINVFVKQEIEQKIIEQEKEGKDRIMKVDSKTQWFLGVHKEEKLTIA